MARQFDESAYKEKMAELLRKEEDELIESLSSQYGYQYLDLRGVTINPEALHLVPEEKAREANLVTFEVRNHMLSVAIRNPNNRHAQAILKALGEKYQLTVFMTAVSSLEHAWDRYKDLKYTTVSSKGVFDITDAEFQRMTQAMKTAEDVGHYISSLKSVNNARKTSETLAAIFAGALGLGASDIHIEPEETNIRLRYRLDGVLQDVYELDVTMHRRLMSRLKLLSGVILNVRDAAQDGRFTFDIGEREIEVRSSIIPGSHGESIVMRLLDPSVASFSMDKLGLNGLIERVIREEISRPNGMIITTGPTGSGKTTALYAFLQEVHKPEVKIITIENPVEYKIDNIVQTQTSENYTFASGLRAVLRQDPDVIMVGEIRDREVAETAVQAAQTGHLVFSTLHTNSAAAAFARMIDLGVDYRTLGNAVNLVLGQRLVRLLCEKCKKSRSATEEEYAALTRVLATHPSHPIIPNPLTLYEPVGCAQCGQSGFKGRKAIFEAIKVDTEIEDMIIRDPREHMILEAARHQGIPTMQEDGAAQVVAGRTSLAELTRVIDIYKYTSKTDPIGETVATHQNATFTNEPPLAQHTDTANEPPTEVLDPLDKAFLDNIV